jgi:hypothetical protein
MNSYATEQLARQRHDQFAREAHADRLAQSANPLGRPSVGQSRVWRVGGLIGRLGHAIVALISRSVHQPRGAKDSPVSGRATSPRRA